MLKKRLYHLARALLGDSGVRNAKPRLNKPSTYRHVGKECLSPEFRLSESPLDCSAHFELAKRAFAEGSFHLAIAEARTASALGLEIDVVDFIQQAEEKAIARDLINHNQWHRLTVIHRAIESLASRREKYSVMDVGGGDGKLVRWLPADSDYVLVEPMINGISGTDLPFADESFDIVVACHVLEHIPIEERTRFLEQLTAKARWGVVLLNPFLVSGLDELSRLDLLIEITNADWAIEHRECTLPRVNLVQEFAESRGLECQVEPSGTMSTSLALAFCDHYAEKADSQDELYRIHQFFNSLGESVLNSKQFPNAYLITIRK